MKRTINVIIVAIFLSMISGCQTEENKKSLKEIPNKIQRIDSLFRSQNRQDLFHGGVVITHKRKTIYENYLGIADRKWNIPVDKDVKFDIASVNKSMIAALTLKAVEKDLLKLDDKLVNLLSDFTYEGQFEYKITLHHLLSHTSGIPDYQGVNEDLRKNNFQRFKRLDFTNEEYVNFISKIKPVSKPGEQFYYSNFGYHLVAIILEETYGKPFELVLKENLTDPLGLKNTVSQSNNEIVIPQLAEAYNYQESTGQWNKNPFIDLSLGRRIYSTAADLNRWAQVMDNPGYLSSASLELMRQNHLTQISKSMSYGYGWVVFDKDNRGEMGDLGISKPYIIHGGSTDGYKAMLININRGQYVISFLSNAGNLTQEMQLAQKIIHILIK